MHRVLSNGVRALIVVIATLFFWISMYFFSLREATGFRDYLFLGTMATVSGFVILIPEILFISRGIRSRVNGRFRTVLGGAIALPIILSWLGTFRWYTAGWGYDSLVHFMSSGFGAFMVLLVLVMLRADHFKPRLAVFTIFVLIIFVSGIANELFERYGDLWWGTHMFGEAGQPDDTARDILYNVLGAGVGSVVCLWRGDALVKYVKRSE